MIEGLQPYPVMKDSGVLWLGEVPEHWEIKPLKRLVLLQRGHDLPADARKSGDIPIISSSGLIGTHSRAAAKGPGIVTGRYGTIGKFTYTDRDYWPLNTTLYSVDLRGNNALFTQAFLTFMSPLFIANAGKSAVPGVDRNDIHPLPSLVPPLLEQSAIVRFLDHADRRIRRCIRTKRKLIHLLEEQKQAVILHAVTRGLVPNVPLKPSGLEWLGDVPSHWEVKPAKFFYRETDERSATGSEELLSVSHITGVTPRRLKAVTMFMAESYAGHKLCRPGDLVINTMWAWMAALGVARQAGIVSPAYGVYRPLLTSPLLPEYADLLLRSQPYVSEYNCRSTGIQSSRLRLYPEQFLRIRLICPPIDEQEAIIRHLEVATANLSRAIDATQREIALLNEYRTRLIADVVTGKLDVRAAVASLPDVAEEPDDLDDADMAENGGDDMADDELMEANA